jgi:tRNA G18 (ribose-2'-O)-methylase SpoU
MATETTDYTAVLDFIQQTKLRECYRPTPDIPDELRDEANLLSVIPYLGLGLSAEYGKEQGAEAASPQFQAFAAGWTELEGVMLLTPEPKFDADMRVAIAARNERALRDLLRAFPAGKRGFFYLGGAWMLPTLAELLDGQAMPSREGYYAAQNSFTPRRDYPARRLEPTDYPLVQDQWSESVWRELMEGGYAVHACQVDAALCALCFHWQVAPWRCEVHGLQAVRDYRRPFAESAITSATEEVIGQGKIATCTANRSDSHAYLRAFGHVGYRLFYRVPSYLGTKRGSGPFRDVSADVFFGTAGRRPPPERIQSPGEGRHIQTSKDPILVQFSDLAHAAGRRERAQFVVEGVLLTQRALDDGLPVETILYTPGLLRALEGVGLLSAARQAGVAHALVTEGLMGKVTTTRPVPAVAAAVCAGLRDANTFQVHRGTTLLIAENILNPDNLGMILRTADAAGAEGVIVAGEKSDPFHKNCVRAARGAVGRIPLLACRSLEPYLFRLQTAGMVIAGAALAAERELYRCLLEPPVAVVVGNEQTGISAPVLAACTLRVRIPMAPGQDSLNVGVAAGLMLYEVLRQKSAGSSDLSSEHPVQA